MEALYVKESSLTEKAKAQILRTFEYRFYDEKACARCEVLPDRHTDVCDACPAFKGQRATAKPVTLNETSFISVPRGGYDRLIDILDTRGYEDILVKSKFPEADDFHRPIRLLPTTKLHVYQEEAVQAILKFKGGIIKAPPRAGKTLLSVAAICRIGKKALILASQRDWLMQFRETFLGSETQPGFTNARESQIGFPKKLADFDKYDVCLCTVQSFMNENGKKILEEIKDLFEITVVDEVHGGGALATSRVLSRLNSRYRIGLTGTPDRKDGLFLIVEDLFGDIIYDAKVARMRPIVSLLRTPGKFHISKGGGQNAFTSLQTRLENNTPRRDAILKEAIRLSKQGHLVLIPMSRVASILNWVREINYETERPGYALPFYGGLKKDRREEIIKIARNYDCRILIGNIALLQVGLNIPRASCLIEIGVNNNLPKAEQRFSRILTPMDGKPTPLIVFTLDDSDVMRKCRRSEYWNALKPKINPRIDPCVERELMEWFQEETANLKGKRRGKNVRAQHPSLNEGF
jgi:superfamily II DNA or RNA helicase